MSREKRPEENGVTRQSDARNQQRRGDGAEQIDSRTRQGSGDKPLVVVTGAAGKIGTALVKALAPAYRVIGIDLSREGAACEVIETDLTSSDAVTLAVRDLAERHGSQIASVIHLAAYFDFTGENSPAYEAVNVEGTRNLIQALRTCQVEQFIYSGTMLVHRPGAPGVPITEQAEIDPKWAYPQSKARAEEVIRAERGEMACVFLHLAGLYSETTGVPTLVQQIRRIYEREFKAHAYSGDPATGQSLLHEDDMIDAFVRTVDRRADLPGETTMLVGEPEAMGYDELQETLARLIHGSDDWTTVSVPKPLAAAGAWLETRSEPLVPDALDYGEKPFIRPFMVEMASDHYELDISRARDLLGWRPRHRIRDTLPKLIAALKSDPLGWYEANGLTVPHWLSTSAERTGDPEALRVRAEDALRSDHDRFRWTQFLNIGFGSWLVASPPLLGYESWAMTASDVVAGLLIMALSFVALSWRFGAVRWLVAGLGLWVMFAPLLFWAPTAQAYLNGTLVGALVFGFAVATRPAPGISRVAASTGPTVPPGWEYSPSAWFQRLPIILLALVGLYVSRYLAAYQLGHIDSVLEPFFSLGAIAGDGKNGTEEIITSSVSRAWPVPDAGLGALVYMLEILIALIGSAQRWRTMPWLVLIFGILIVPLGVISVSFIVIQPIVLGTWCTLCLITAAAMLIQIPYSVDELVATCQFLARRRRQGHPLLRVLLFGDTDDGPDESARDDFDRGPKAIMGEMVSGGISLPWTLLASIGIGLWLMLTRLTLGTEGTLAHADHLVGALAITVAVTATAEVARPIRFLNIPLGMALVITALVADATTVQMLGDVIAGLALVALSIPRGPVRRSYGGWSRFIV
ncbi:MAG: NAD-dependent epimerase/dehydratase family protein [Hoeflea sp.]|uniref:vitamin K epoxide reductase family protein n=1 Tax=Hoeflea sp. TaxID=1940281 RepID=UPI002730299D|nr:vitamin K epoxide reductase family protein [Hoeflea sp.]MDP2121942.1 NAD-dependent epimerase/dehydratase family protein [Hoeflea sp.]